jgi:hypothetical protein
MNGSLENDEDAVQDEDDGSLVDSEILGESDGIESSLSSQT